MYKYKLFEIIFLNSYEKLYTASMDDSSLVCNKKDTIFFLEIINIRDITNFLYIKKSY